MRLEPWFAADFWDTVQVERQDVAVDECCGAGYVEVRTLTSKRSCRRLSSNRTVSKVHNQCIVVSRSPCEVVSAERSTWGDVQRISASCKEPSFKLRSVLVRRAKSCVASAVEHDRVRRQWNRSSGSDVLVRVSRRSDADGRIFEQREVERDAYLRNVLVADEWSAQGTKVILQNVCDVDRTGFAWIVEDLQVLGEWLDGIKCQNHNRSSTGSLWGCKVHRLWICIVVGVGIHNHGECVLLQVASCRSLLRGCFRLREDREEDGSQDGDDGDYNQ